MMIFSQLATVAMVALGLWMMMSSRPEDGKPFSGDGLKALKFFTVLSNILAGLTSLGVLVCAMLGTGLGTALVWKYVGTVSVTLTFFVTACFLAPKEGSKAPDLYRGGNFFFHLAVPLVCMASCVWLEKAELSFAMTLWGVVPMALYAVYYLIGGLRHREGDRVDPEYDWYGFFSGGVHTVPLVLLVMFLATWAMAILLWLPSRIV